MPEVPPLSGTLSEIVEAAFAPDGPLARSIPDFEARPGQVEMAAAVARCFEAGGVLLAQAGTGTGKTLAYLLPAILSRQRVLVSTGTKNLQEQIYFKDVPALRDALGVPFTATCMKGRANYLCLHRLDQLETGTHVARASALDPAVHILLPIIRDWSRHTDTGDRAELESLPEDLPFWREIAATTDTCLGTECPRYDECFITRMRQRAAASDVVVVNHHLLCADAAVRQNAYGEVIPPCFHAIVDEAHQLEDVATQYFGLSVSNYRLDDLAQDIERLLGSGSLEGVLLEGLDRLRDQTRTFFAALAQAGRPERGAGAPNAAPALGWPAGGKPGEAGPPSESERGWGPASMRERLRPERGAGGKPGEAGPPSESERGWGPASMRDERVRVTAASLAPLNEAAARLTGALDLIEGALAPAGHPSRPLDDADAEPRPDVAALARRAVEVQDDLRRLLLANEPEYVYFVEFRGRGVFLRAAPIDVSAIVRELLVDRLRTTVLTSATLTVDGSFAYIRERLGIAGADEISLPSEFDFRRQAILYLPRRMPDPRSREFSTAAGREVVDILKRTRGRAFVLFTSWATMRDVQAIAAMALDYPILVQGTAPRTELLRQFRETPHAVLFATSSFWQGVDVAGQALSCVVVDKLPFASPADPVTSARIDAIRNRGGDPFGEYQLPLAVLALQQGLGRLIRHRRDRGVLAVLDPRLRTRWYGRRFLASLPPAPIVADLVEIETFLAGGPSGRPTA